MPTTIQRRSVKNREALLRAAQTLFRAQGFEATTIDQIAAGAGVSRRTFFRHFASKDAVVFPAAEERIARFRQGLRAGAGQPLGEAVRRAALAMAEEFSSNKDELLLQHDLMAASPELLAREYEIDRRWEEALYEALRASRRKELQARVLAGAIAGALRAVLRLWLAGRGRQDLASLATEALETLGDLAEEEGK